jgi:hypothetical protein
MAEVFQPVPEPASIELASRALAFGFSFRLARRRGTA